MGLNQDKSIETWNNVAKLPLDELKLAMSAAYDKDTSFFPTTKYRFLDSTKKLKILDFGGGIGRQVPELVKYAEFIDLADVGSICDIVCNPESEFLFPEAATYRHVFSIEELEGLLTHNTKYDMVVCSFVFQFFYSKEYLDEVLKVLSSISPYIYVHSRIWMEDGTNIFETLFNHPDLNLELGDGQDLGFLIGQTKDSPVHIEQVYSSKKVSPKIVGHIGDNLNKPGNFIYKSYNDAFSDLRKWAQKLQLSGVAGIPRSGSALAAYLSHHLNIPLYSLEGIRSDEPFYRPNNCRPLKKDLYGKILVLDDTCWSGFAIGRVKEYLSHSKYQKENKLLYGALYCSEHAVNANHVDTYYEIFPSVNHTFEWNFFRDPITQKYIVDMDGVLCDDYQYQKEDNEYEKYYIEHLINAKPKNLPTYPVYKIVTGRLEKWRTLTEEWLKKHGVIYNELAMFDWGDLELRDFAVIDYKVNHYNHDKYGVCFVESDINQAKDIARLTKKPVFCMDTKTVIP